MIPMLLALDTATTTASIALYDPQPRQLLAELTWQARRRQTQDLLPALGEVLRLLRATPPEITALAVTTGPGSFTGVRIAISAAKGLALGLPQPPPMIGIPTLSVTAAPYLELAATSGAVVCALIQAGRGRCNWAWFGAGDILHRPTVADHQAGSVAELAAALAAAGETGKSVWLTGEISPDLEALLPALPHVTGVDPGWLPCTWPRVTPMIRPPCSRSI
jgi:tRNA threonylcarbamoyl adenosine modification protein YeaZ